MTWFQRQKQLIAKFNPYHDDKGRFTNGPSLASRMLESGKNSGFTLDKNNRTPAKGFSVGVFPEKTGIWDVDKVSEGEIGNWLSQHAQEAFSQGYKIGGWVDNNKFYLDIVKVFPPSQREQAIQAGKEHNQIAIADLAAIHNGDWGNAFIKTGGTGEMKKTEQKPKPVKKKDQKPKFTLFDKGVTAKQIMEHFGFDKRK